MAPRRFKGFKLKFHAIGQQPHAICLIDLDTNARIEGFSNNAKLTTQKRYWYTIYVAH